MKFSTRVTSISYLKGHAAEIVKDVTENREPIGITQCGEVKLVVMDAKNHDDRKETLALLSILALSNAEIEQGKFRNAEDVFSYMRCFR